MSISESDGFVQFSNAVRDGITPMDIADKSRFISEGILGVRHLWMFPRLQAKTLALRFIGINIGLLIGNSGCSSEQLTALASGKDWLLDEDLLTAILKHPNCTDDLVRRIGEHVQECEFNASCEYSLGDRYSDDDYLLPKLILQHPACPKDYWNSNHRNDMVWGSAARNPAVSAEELRAMVTENSTWLHVVHGGDNLAYGAAANPNCPAEMLRSIIEWRWTNEDAEPCDESGEVRLAVLAHPNCPEDLRLSLIDELSESDEIQIKLALCRNSYISSDLRKKLFDELSKSKDFATLLAISELQDCPSSIRKNIFTKLGKNKKIEVRLRVAENPFCDVLLRAAILDSLTNQGEVGLSALAKSVAATENQLSELAQHPNYAIRCSVATNPRTPVPLLEALAADPHLRVQLFVALNQNCPPSLWRQMSRPYLTSDAVEWPAIKQILESTKPDSPIIDKLYFDGSKVGKALRPHQYPAISALALLSTKATPSQLAKYSRNKEWICRAAVALNPNTNMEIRNKLKSDKHEIVREFASAITAIH